MSLEDFKRLFANNDTFAISSKMRIFNECKRKAHPESGKGFKLTLWLDRNGEKEVSFASYEDFFKYEYEEGKTIKGLLVNTPELYYLEEEYEG